MDSDASSVTLIFYKLNNRWWEEAGLNLLAAAAQMSPYTHVEIQIGNNHAPGGQMKNVARVFNDSVGVELCQRTGKNPGTLHPPLYAHTAPLPVQLMAFRSVFAAYSYLSLGCSAVSTQRMLQFARAQVGKPFSNLAMARALFFPRKTHGGDWCAVSFKLAPPFAFSHLPLAALQVLCRAGGGHTAAGWTTVRRYTQTPLPCPSQATPSPSQVP